ncbi:hypothetical protein FB451DRAFT_1381001 [Mycena latifolia]|nr:hypothetical protein FB451DRAFT_1381001 [Mycena latifolia]
MESGDAVHVLALLAALLPTLRPAGFKIQVNHNTMSFTPLQFVVIQVASTGNFAAMFLFHHISRKSALKQWLRRFPKLASLQHVSLQPRNIAKLQHAFFCFNLRTCTMQTWVPERSSTQFRDTRSSEADLIFDELVSYRKTEAEGDSLRASEDRSFCVEMASPRRVQTAENLKQPSKNIRDFVRVTTDLAQIS